MAREHARGILDHTEAFQLLCGCNPPASPEHFTIHAFLDYFARAREIALNNGVRSRTERRNIVYEVNDEHDRFPGLALGPDEGLQDRLNMAHRDRMQAEFQAFVFRTLMTRT